MESILILIAIFVVDAVIKSRRRKAAEQEEREMQKRSSRMPPAPSYDEDEENEDGYPEYNSPTGMDRTDADRAEVPKSLQDLIKQFEYMQRDPGTRGNDPDFDDAEEISVPEKHAAKPAEDNETKFWEEEHNRRKIAEQQEMEKRVAEIKARSSQDSVPDGIMLGLSDSAEKNDGAGKLHRKFKNASMEEIRRGFIWAKVLDEPRFKKRWSARAR